MEPTEKPVRPRPPPPTPEQIRRRRTALGVVAGVAAILGVVVGAGGGGGDDAGSAADAAPLCPERIAADPARLVGQRLVARMEDAPTGDQLERARRGELGGVIVFPSDAATATVIEKGVEELREAALVGGFEAPLVAIDQEGGEVKRLPELPPTIAPPEIESEGGAATAHEQGMRDREGAEEDRDRRRSRARSWISARRARSSPPARSPTTPPSSPSSGPSSRPGSPRRAWRPRRSISRASAPPSADSDAGESVVDSRRAQLDPGLEPFAAAIDANIPLVMTANATYTAIDDEAPAALSRAVTTGLLREDLGFDGLIVTDDLGAGAIAAAGISEDDAAVAAASAGADLLLLASSDGEAATKALERALRKGELDEASFVESCERLTILRERLERLSEAS